MEHLTVETFKEKVFDYTQGITTVQENIQKIRKY